LTLASVFSTSKYLGHHSTTTTPAFFFPTYSQDYVINGVHSHSDSICPANHPSFKAFQAHLHQAPQQPPKPPAPPAPTLTTYILPTTFKMQGPQLGALGAAFTVVRAMQIVCLISIIGMTSNFVSEMVTANQKPPQVIIGTLSVVSPQSYLI
jgi:hypothetical protein